MPCKRLSSFSPSRFQPSPRFNLVPPSLHVGRRPVSPGALVWFVGSHSNGREPVLHPELYGEARSRYSQVQKADELIRPMSPIVTESERISDSRSTMTVLSVVWLSAAPARERRPRRHRAVFGDSHVNIKGWRPRPSSNWSPTKTGSAPAVASATPRRRSWPQAVYYRSAVSTGYGD